jgi:hypothetical protein
MQAAAEGAPQAKKPFSKMDFTALVVTAALKTPAQVMSHVKNKGSTEMQVFIVKHQARLKAWLEEAWEWDGAEAQALDEQMSGLERVQRSAVIFVNRTGFTSCFPKWSTKSNVNRTGFTSCFPKCSTKSNAHAHTCILVVVSVLSRTRSTRVRM